MVKNKHSAGFLQVFLLVALIVAAGVTIWIVMYNRQHAHEVQVERAHYAELDSQAQHYIETINAKYPGKVSHKATCGYTSAKYSKGSLGCDVSSSIEYESVGDLQATSLIDYVKKSTKSLPWGNYTSSKSYTGRDSDPRDTNLIFNNTTPTCSISYYFSANSILIDASCGGGALAEYYPVVGD